VSSSPTRLIFETENMTGMHYMLVPLFPPHELQAIYFLERESPDTLALLQHRADRQRRQQSGGRARRVPPSTGPWRSFPLLSRASPRIKSLPQHVDGIGVSRFLRPALRQPAPQSAKTMNVASNDPFLLNGPASISRCQTLENKEFTR